MLRSVRDEDFETEEVPRDVELTLGPAMLFAIVCGLLLLCGLCFGLGYTSGRRSAAHLALSAKEAASGQTLDQASNALQKPAAKGVTPAAPEATPAAAPQSDASSAASARSNDSSAAQPAQSVVRPAMQPESSGTQWTSVPGTAVQPALAPGSGVMVQVAAVSHLEDASVLMGALRKRGYAVTARRSNEDNLIHVQVGPFASRADANAMSQRLLSDGYNAVVLP
ncbi:MAG: SPOR domain-containing protein [Terracidiphilus sp.]